jgi:hypothetical protein
MLYFVRGSGEMEKMGTNNRSENGRSVRVVSDAHASHLFIYLFIH